MQYVLTPEIDHRIKELPVGIIKLVFYLIIITVSIINVIVYYSGKRDKKKMSRKVVENTPFHRTVLPEERRAVQALYGETIDYGEKVYAVEGELTSLILRTNNSQTETVYTLGDVVVQWENRHKTFLTGNNRAEIILPQRKKGAIILTLNGGYSLIDEEKIQAALEKEASYTDENLTLSRSRMVTDREQDWLFKDYRWFPILLFLPLTVLSAVLPSPPFQIGTAAGALGIFLLFILGDRYPLKYHIHRKELVRVKGPLSGAPGAYNLDRFSLIFPAGWEKDLSPGREISLEAYPQGTDGYQLRVLSMEPFLSIDKEEEKNPTRRPHRFILFASLSLITLLILLFAGEIPLKGRHFYNYVQTRDLPADFSGWDEISSFSFQNGQYVNLTIDTAYLPLDNYEGILLTDDSPFPELDLAPLRQRIALIEELQRTEDYIYIASYDLSDSNKSYMFLLEALDAGEGTKELEDFTGDFRDSASFPVLREIAEALNWVESVEDFELIPYPAGGLLKEKALKVSESEEGMTGEFLLGQIKRIPLMFLQEQTDWLNEELTKAQSRLLEGRPRIRLEEYYSDNDRWPDRIGRDDLALYVFTTFTGINESYEIRDRVGAEEKLKAREEKWESPLIPWQSSGVITNHTFRNADMDTISLDVTLDYDNVEKEGLDILFTLLPLCYIIAGFLSYLLGRNRRGNGLG